MTWYKIKFPDSTESYSKISEIRTKFYIFIHSIASDGFINEHTSIFQNREAKENYTVYISPTSDYVILRFIKELSAEPCPEPKPQTVSFLGGDNIFWSKLFA